MVFIIHRPNDCISVDKNAIAIYEMLFLVIR
jgi:hypothetical protein